MFYKLGNTFSKFETPSTGTAEKFFTGRVEIFFWTKNIFYKNEAGIYWWTCHNIFFFKPGQIWRFIEVKKHILCDVTDAKLYSAKSIYICGSKFSLFFCEMVGKKQPLGTNDFQLFLAELLLYITSMNSD